MLRHVGRYPLQPLLCLGDGTCPQQLVKEWHHSGAVPCLLLHPLGLQRAKAAEGRVSLLKPRTPICADSRATCGSDGGSVGALFVVGFEKGVPHSELGGTLGLATIDAITDASVVEANLVAGAPHAQ